MKTPQNMNPKVGQYIYRTFYDNTYSIGKITSADNDCCYYTILESNYHGTIIGGSYTYSYQVFAIIADTLEEINKIRTFQ